MPLEAILSIVVVLLCLALLVFTKYSPDVILFGGVTLLVVSGCLSIKDAVAGFSNEGLLTVGVMFVIAAGLRDTGAVDLVNKKILGKASSVRVAQFKLMLPVIGLSGFLNNTPLVAAFIPIVSDWTKKIRISPSKLMMPLAFAASLGGVITIIGTSTNLIVNGLLVSQTHHRIGFFEVGYVGLPVAIAGFLFLLIFGNKLLPERKPAFESFSDPKEYTTEMIVEPGSPLHGQTIESAGLRHLPGLYLVEVDRNGSVLTAVSSEEKIYENDRLIFAGIVDSVVDLQKIKGLKPATNQIFKLNTPRVNRGLIEVVVSERNPLINKSIRESEFRNYYNAVVIAVARNGERINKKIGDIEIMPGDTLLLEAHRSFLLQHRNSRDFLLMRPIENSYPIKHEKGWIAWTILFGMILLASFDILNILTAAMLAAGLMIITKCVSAQTARRSIEVQVILVIAASFGIGKALEVTGAAKIIADSTLGFIGDDPWLLLIGIYFLTWIMTEILTNNAAAILMFPIAYAAVSYHGFNFIPYAITIMIAASVSFSTPIGYQTNLMVYSPGGYRFNDYVKIGVPLSIIVGIVTILLIPLIWSLR